MYSLDSGSRSVDDRASRLSDTASGFLGSSHYLCNCKHCANPDSRLVSKNRSVLTEPARLAIGAHQQTPRSILRPQSCEACADMSTSGSYANAQATPNFLDEPKFSLYPFEGRDH